MAQRLPLSRHGHGRSRYRPSLTLELSKRPQTGLMAEQTGISQNTEVKREVRAIEPQPEAQPEMDGHFPCQDCRQITQIPQMLGKRQFQNLRNLCNLWSLLVLS